MTLTTALEEKVATLERDTLALRKLLEATQELGEERIRALFGATLNGNGHTNGNGHAALVAAEATETATEAETEAETTAEPRGREAIRLIVATRYGIWTLAQLREEMKRKEWFTSNKGVEVAVTRMCRNSEARRVSKGRYEFFDPEDRRLL